MSIRPSLTIDRSGPCVVVTLAGEFDLDVADSVNDALAVALERDHQVVVDLTATEFMDSAALGCLVLAAKVARSAGGWIRLAGPQRSIRRTLRITGLDSMLPIYASAEDACSATDPDLLEPV